MLYGRHFVVKLNSLCYNLKRAFIRFVDITYIIESEKPLYPNLKKCEMYFIAFYDLLRPIILRQPVFLIFLIVINTSGLKRFSSNSMKKYFV